MYRKVHVLDIGYQYSGLMDWQRAAWLVFTGRAEALINSDIQLRPNFYLPRVVRIMKSIRKFFKHGVPWTREYLFIRDGNVCQYCGETFKKSELEVEHVMPKSRGGRWTWDNTVTACRPCNNRKGNKTPHEAGMSFFIRGFKPYRPTVMEFFLALLKRDGLAGAFAELEIY